MRTQLDSDSGLTVRTLGRSRRVLLASPGLAGALSAAGDVAEVVGLPTLTTNENATHETWVLQGPDGATRSLRHEPRLASSNFTLLREAAVVGLGVALLPDHICWPALQEGKLVRLFPDWYAQEGIVHLVFTARRGLPPAVRTLIDHLAEHFRREEQAARQAGTPTLAARPALRRL